jgi:hypothetical protein
MATVPDPTPARGASMPPDRPLTRRLDRRRFLVLGGVSAGLTAAAVACAKEDQAIPVSGSVAQPASITQPPVTDAVYLRTSSSIVYNAIESYGTLMDTKALTADDADLVTFIIDQHQQQADRLGDATVAVGGQAFAKPNPSVTERIVTPAIKAINDGGPDPLDILRYINAFETLISASLQGYSPSVIDGTARHLMMGIVGAVNRYSAVTVSRIDGFTRVGTEEAQQQEAASGSAPLLTGPGATANTAPSTSATAKPPLPVAQVPGAFASLAAVEVVLGGIDLTWETPGPNSYIYEE